MLENILSIVKINYNYLYSKDCCFQALRNPLGRHPSTVSESSSINDFVSFKIIRKYYLYTRYVFSIFVCIEDADLTINKRIKSAEFNNILRLVVNKNVNNIISILN